MGPRRAPSPGRGCREPLGRPPLRLHLRVDRRPDRPARVRVPRAAADPDPARPDPVRGQRRRARGPRVARPAVPRSRGGARPGRAPPGPGHRLHHARIAPALQPSRRDPGRGGGEAPAADRGGGGAGRTRGGPPALAVPRRGRLDRADPAGNRLGAIARACAGDRRGLLREPVDPPAPAGTRRALSPGRVPGPRGAATPWPGPSSTPWSGSASSSGAAPRRWRCTRAIPSIASAGGSASTRSSPRRSTRATSRAPASPSSRRSTPTSSTTAGSPRPSSRPPGSATTPLTCRFASELARRQPAELRRLDLAAVYAPLVRHGDAARAVRGGPRAPRPGPVARDRRPPPPLRHLACRDPRADGRPAEAAEIYKDLVSSSSPAPQVALDAAETLLDNNHRSHARPFLAQRASSPARPESGGWRTGRRPCTRRVPERA